MCLRSAPVQASRRVPAGPRCAACRPQALLRSGPLFAPAACTSRLMHAGLQALCVPQRLTRAGPVGERQPFWPAHSMRVEQERAEAGMAVGTSPAAPRRHRWTQAGPRGRQRRHQRPCTSMMSSVMSSWCRMLVWWQHSPLGRRLPRAAQALAHAASAPAVAVCLVGASYR